MVYFVTITSGASVRRRGVPTCARTRSLSLSLSAERGETIEIHIRHVLDISGAASFGVNGQIMDVYSSTTSAGADRGTFFGTERVEKEGQEQCWYAEEACDACHLQPLYSSQVMLCDWG